MVDASSSPGVAPDPDALTDKLAGVMAVNSLSAESMLARFFTDDTLGAHLAAAYGKSGKGNPATLAARLVAQWKPSRSGDASGARGAKKRKNEDDQSGEEAATEARSVGGEGGAKEVDIALENHSCVEDEVWKKDDDADEREETRALPPPPKKRFHHDRS